MNYHKILFSFLAIFFLSVLSKDENEADGTILKQPRLYKVAVVGGGIGGAAFIHFFNQLPKEHQVQIDVYEANYKVRLEKINYVVCLFNVSKANNTRNENMLNKIEIGASIFIGENYWVHELSKSYGLTANRTQSDPKNKKGDFGIWDTKNEEWMFLPKKNILSSLLTEESQINQLTDGLYTFWHFSPKKFLDFAALAKNFISRFRKYYTEWTNQSFPNAIDFWKFSDMFDATQQNCSTYLMEHLNIDSLSHPILNEFVLSLNRGNYNQKLDTNALVCLTSMASVVGGSNEIYSIVEGNQALVDRMIRNYIPRERIFLKHDIFSIKKLKKKTDDDYGYQLYLEDKRKTREDVQRIIALKLDPEKKENRKWRERFYDFVVIATPLYQSKIKFLGDFDQHTHEQMALAKDGLPYKKVHTTFIQGRLNTKYFFKSESDETKRTQMRDSLKTIGVGNIFNNKTLFNLIGKWSDHSGLQHPLYKIFSDEALSDEDLNTIFIQDTHKFIKKHVWKGAYPKYGIKAVFPDIVLDDGGIYYNNAIEAGTSAMEVMILAGKNTALLFHQHLTKIHSNSQHSQTKDEL
ncbi:hypothetical protein RFI_17430 [Reticulomyxa filosa]|uniref:Prenylcysteine lyase domain-containing protein n=1 Tax=Reticulomyxa filosa TaxID=46433 RepID=X6N3B5_RETFI|nr:hypothetical protein RFI_17430 [Reticulomyxa filosa]|eukprot:ETO19802.1 hypothetical protein RFI_17430 [Reticulomyxa filosa]